MIHQLLRVRLRLGHKTAASSSFTLSLTIGLLLILILNLFVLILAQEYPTFDGFYHNQHYPDWGSIEQPFLRMGGGTLYRDKTYQPVETRPNPRVLSQELFATPPSTEPLTSLKNRTALLVFYGQQLFAELHDGLHAGCPVEYFNIPIPKCDPQFDPKCTGTAQMPFTRSKYLSTSGQGPSAPRAQLSENSAWIDGGSIYGNGKTWSDCLRSRHGGRLKALAPDGKFPALNDPELPFANVPPPTDNPGPGLIRHPKLRNVKDFMVHGNKAGNENPAVLALQVLWFRNHNYHANRLAALYGVNVSMAEDDMMDMGATNQATYWNDERLFLEARKWNVAEYQAIAAYEFLPAFTGQSLPPYHGYISTINPMVAETFQLAAMRFGHSLVPSAVLRRDLSKPDQCLFRPTSSKFGLAGKAALRTCNTLQRANEILKVEGADEGIDSMAELLVGLSNQYSEREDMLMTDDLRNFVFGPVNYNRRDLAALNIQRGRDNGVTDYNTVRQAYGLPRRDRFDQISADPIIQLKLAQLYDNSTNLIDLFVGGLAESIDGPGELFTAILVDQFQRVRDGDRFWFENEQNGLFSPDEIQQISQIRFGDLIRRHTGLTAQQVSDTVFFLNPSDPCHPPPGLGALNLENCTALAMHDYWTDAEPSALPGTAMMFVGFFFCCLFGVWMTLIYEKRRRAKIMAEIDASFNRQNSLTTQVRAAELQRFFQHLIASSIHNLPTNTHASKAAAAAAASDLPSTNVAPSAGGGLSMPSTRRAQSNPIVTTPHSQAYSTNTAPTNTVAALPINIEMVPVNAVTPSKTLARLPHPPPLHPLPTASGAHPFVTNDPSLRSAAAHGAVTARTSPTPTSFNRVSQRNRSLEPSVIHPALANAMQEASLDLDETEALLDIEVTLAEFAAALELEEDHAFPRHIFAMADRHKTGLVSFRALEHVLLTLSKGEQLAKLRLLFDLYDMNGSGTLEVEEVTNMLRESLRCADEYDTPDREARVEIEVMEAVTEMYRKLTKDPGDPVDFHDFQIMLTTNTPSSTDGSGRQEGELAADESKEQTTDTTKVDGSTTSQQRDATATPAPPTTNPVVAPKPSLLHRLLQRSNSRPTSDSRGKRGNGLTELFHLGNGKRAKGDKGNSPSMPKKPSAQSKKQKNRQKQLSSDSPFSQPISQQRLDSHVIMTKGSSGQDLSQDGKYLQSTLGDSPPKRSTLMRIRTFINTNRSEIFILVLFYLITFGIFAERFWSFAQQTEHVGIRRITGYSVPVTRGCASAIAFTLSAMLLTVCKNLLSYLQSTRAARFIPFASAISFHILIAYTCAFFTLGHIVGHFFNWYQISTQPVVDAPCYLPDVALDSNFLPSFTFWMYGTPTNMTGIILTFWMIFFYVIAICRNYLYSIFLYVHKWFILIYILVVLHGCHQIFAYPVFWPFFIGPAMIYIFDKLWSFARVNSPLPVLSAQILPSKVVKLTIARPSHLTYTSGQYVRLSSDYITRNDWHPFSVTTAPNHDYLSVHVRAVGPWTYKFYQLYHPMHLIPRPDSAKAIMQGKDDALQKSKSPSQSSGAPFMDHVRAGFVASSLDYYLPPVNLDGPFGGGHTEWAKFRTVVLIGAGIGITPFASILQDFMHRVQMERLQEKEKERKRKKRDQQERGLKGGATNIDSSGVDGADITKKNMNGQRVPLSTPNSASSSSSSHPPLRLYFIWIGRSHTGYEWLIDMIREAESLDHATGKLHLQVQMYITTPPQQFDLRTLISVSEQVTQLSHELLTWVYAFERHFEKWNGCSLFSGLRSSIGWGRPDFSHLFELIAARHQQQQIGVFSSGGPGVLESVQKSCDHINSFQGSHFHHYAEQFQ